MKKKNFKLNTKSENIADELVSGVITMH